jgi:hypothetical protein
MKYIKNTNTAKKRYAVFIYVIGVEFVENPNKDLILSSFVIAITQANITIPIIKKSIK